MPTDPFLAITRRVGLITYRRFGITYRVLYLEDATDRLSRHVGK